MQGKQKVVNLFAGPGAGKSTMSMWLASTLKDMGQRAEFVDEYVKRGEWEGRTGKVRNNQYYIWAKQLFRQRVLDGEVNFIVTDSPLLFSVVYDETPFLPSLGAVIEESFSHYDNLNLFLPRTKRYQKYGRSQTRKQAVHKDNQIRNMLTDGGHTVFDISYGKNGITEILGIMHMIGWLKDKDVQRADL